MSNDTFLGIKKANCTDESAEKAAVSVSELNDLLAITATVRGLYSDESKCICCDGKHRFGTISDWDFTEKQKVELKPHVEISTVMQRFVHKLPTGTKIKMTLEVIGS